MFLGTYTQRILLSDYESPQWTDPRDGRELIPRARGLRDGQFRIIRALGGFRELLAPCCYGGSALDAAADVTVLGNSPTIARQGAPDERRPISGDAHIVERSRSFNAIHCDEREHGAPMCDRISVRLRLMTPRDRSR